MPHVFMEHGSARQAVAPGGELRLVGQMPVNEKVCGFDERRPFSQLFNGYSPVAENPLVAINERDCARCGCRVHERRIQGHETCLRSQMADVDRALALSPNDNRNLELLIRHRNSRPIHRGILR